MVRQKNLELTDSNYSIFQIGERHAKHENIHGQSQYSNALVQQLKGNMMLNMKKLGIAALAVASLAMGGCSTTAFTNPKLAALQDVPVFADLRNGPFEIIGENAPNLVKERTSNILESNCAIPKNADPTFCKNPGDFVGFTGQVFTGAWRGGVAGIDVVVPKDLSARGGGAFSEKDGDIVRVRRLPGKFNLFVYDGVIERFDDPNRGCKWEGSHAIGGGVVCPKYDYTNHDIRKHFR